MSGLGNAAGSARQELANFLADERNRETVAALVAFGVGTAVRELPAATAAKPSGPEIPAALAM